MTYVFLELMLYSIICIMLVLVLIKLVQSNEAYKKYNTRNRIVTLGNEINKKIEDDLIPEHPIKQEKKDKDRKQEIPQIEQSLNYISSNERNKLLKTLFKMGVYFEFEERSTLSKNYIGKLDKKVSIDSEVTPLQTESEDNYQIEIEKSLACLEIEHFQNIFSKFINILNNKDTKNSKASKDGNVNKVFNKKMEEISVQKETISKVRLFKKTSKLFQNSFYNKNKYIIPNECSLINMLLFFTYNLNYISSSLILFLLIKYDYGLEIHVYKSLLKQMSLVSFKYFICFQDKCYIHYVKYKMNQIEESLEISKDYMYFRKLVK